jgi:hypothetical protein
VIVSYVVAALLLVVLLFVLGLLVVPPLVRINGNSFRLDTEGQAEGRAEATGRRVRGWCGVAGALIVFGLVLFIGDTDPRPALGAC